MANDSGQSEKSSSELSDSDGEKDKPRDGSKSPARRKHKKSKHSKKKSKKKSSKRKRHRDRSRSRSKQRHSEKAKKFRDGSSIEMDHVDLKSGAKQQTDKLTNQEVPMDASANQEVARVASTNGVQGDELTNQKVASYASTNQGGVHSLLAIKDEPRSPGTEKEPEASMDKNSPNKFASHFIIKSEIIENNLNLNSQEMENSSLEIYDPGLYIAKIKKEDDSEQSAKENKNVKEERSKSKSRSISRDDSGGKMKTSKSREKSQSKDRSSSKRRRSRSKGRRSRSKGRRSRSKERRSRSKGRRSRSKEKWSRSKERRLKGKRSRSRSKEKRSRGRSAEKSKQRSKDRSREKSTEQSRKRSRSAEKSERLKEKSKDISKERSKERTEPRKRSRERSEEKDDKRSTSKERSKRSKSPDRSKDKQSLDRKYRRSRERSHSRQKSSRRSTEHQRSKSRERRRSRSLERRRFVPRYQNSSRFRRSSSTDRRRRSRSKSVGRRRHSRSPERHRRSRSTSMNRGYRSRSRRSRSPRKYDRSNDRKRRSKSKSEDAAASVPVNLTIALGVPTTSVTTTTAGAEPKKSIADFTALCKKLTESKGDEKNEVGENTVEDEKVSQVYHPFSVKPAKEIVIPSVILPVPKPAGPAQPLEQAFPVSSGNQHKTKENTNESVVDGVDGSVAAAEKVFQIAAQQEKLDVSGLIAKRMEAQNRLQSNPHDYEASLMLQEVQMKIQNWASVNLKPGQYTGESLITSLTPKENINSGYQAWARKDMFHNLTPIRGGVGMRLLQKMGWRPGQVIGKRGEGSYEPIALSVKTDRKGLVSFAEAGAKGKGGGKGGGKNVMAAQAVQGKHPVSALAEICTKRRWKAPTYNVAHESGPSHKKDFLYHVIVNGISYQHNIASNNKKLAKAEAAFAALKALGVVPAGASMTL